jgi:hypothetical protein
MIRTGITCSTCIQKSLDPSGEGWSAATDKVRCALKKHQIFLRFRPRRRYYTSEADFAWRIQSERCRAKNF